MYNAGQTRANSTDQANYSTVPVHPPTLQSSRRHSLCMNRCSQKQDGRILHQMPCCSGEHLIPTLLVLLVTQLLDRFFLTAHIKPTIATTASQLMLSIHSSYNRLCDVNAQCLALRIEVDMLPCCNCTTRLSHWRSLIASILHANPQCCPVSKHMLTMTTVPLCAERRNSPTPPMLLALHVHASQCSNTSAIPRC